MKLISKSRAVPYSVSALGILLALTGTDLQAGAMGPTQVTAPEKVYFGVFGGGGASNNVDVNVYGVAFFSEINPPFLGPLDINLFGQTDSRSVGMIGGQVGYQWSELFLNSQFGLSPAVELEGYYLGQSTFTSHEISNESFLLPMHNFETTYPLSSGVALGNFVLNLTPANYTRWHPYLGGGIGAAILSISDADATQVFPVEEGVNHFNGNPSNTVATFAAQTKVGLNFDFTEHFSVFAEYRWLYVAQSSFTFGSTIYPQHVPTSSWNSVFGAQYYNMGSLGARISV
ncbi:MAG: hypothetical protein WC627_07705 [Legionella sp.]|jgi:opacity protein-like surface antigen